MKNLFKYLILTGFLFGFLSCTDFLDRRPDAVALSDEEVFSDYETSQKFIDQLLAPWTYFDDNDLQNAQSGLYEYDTHGKTAYGIRERIVDNCIGNQQYSWVATCNWRQGSQSNSTDRYWSEGSDLRYDTFWKAIRIANISIANINRIQNATNEQKAKILGLAYFCRAHFYFMLVQGWGGMPYLTEPLDPYDDMDFVRLSYAETCQKIAEDFETAAGYLPMVVENIDYGRPSKMGAIAYKAKALLWAACPYSNPENNRQLWVNAAVALAEAISMAENSSYYKLIDFADFKKLFTECNDETFKEILFGRFWDSYRFTMAVYHVGIKSVEFGNGAFGAESVTENLAQCFGWSNGEPIDPSSEEYRTYPYEGVGLANGGHDGRDPRFYQSILYNGAVTPQVAATNRKVEIWNQSTFDGIGAKELTVDAQGQALNGFTLTGYYNWKLYCNTYAGTGTRYQRIMWNYIRMADLYLYYAEAANRAWGPDMLPTGTPGGFSLTAVQSLNKVRERCGMPLFNSAAAEPWLRPGSVDEFEQIIRNETRIETCFEEKRFYDVRRWALCTDPNVLTMLGMWITRTGENDFTYQVTPLSASLHLRWADRHHLFRIKNNDIYLGPNFVQNPGY